MYFFFFSCYGDHRDLHSFPTRRSSDLNCPAHAGLFYAARIILYPSPLCRVSRPTERSEEHTSELQSHSELVCRLLLEKKNHPYSSPPPLPTRSGPSSLPPSTSTAPTSL